MVLASEKFRDIEYIVPRAFFEKSEIKVSVASTKLTATGRFGFSVSSDILIEYLNPADYDGIFFVGGAGSISYMDNTKAKAIFEQFLEQKKPIAAICAAPRNFLKWGILTGKKCTGFNADGEFSLMAKEYGAFGMPEEKVVIDGLILTANGPDASEESALAFIQLVHSAK